MFNNAVLFAVKAGFYLIMPYKQGVFIIKQVCALVYLAGSGERALVAVGQSPRAVSIATSPRRRRHSRRWCVVDAYRRSPVDLFISGYNENRTCFIVRAGGWVVRIFVIFHLIIPILE